MKTNAQTAAARLHEIADRLAAFDGAVPSAWLTFSVFGGGEASRCEQVDALALALTGQPGEAKKTNAGWEHGRKVKDGIVDLAIYTLIDPPAAEDPAKLRARIAELEAQMGATGGAA